MFKKECKNIQFEDEFIEKMEKKITRIEKDFEEGNKTPEELLKELDDSSDID